jgi:DNA-nicking Smr family endonuclease
MAGKRGGKDSGKKTGKSDDLALWKRIAETTKPLPGRKVAEPKAAEPERQRPARPAPVIPPKPPQPEKREPPPLPELAPGIAAGLDRRTAERLRRGRFAVEGRLDLHGHTQASAHRALMTFVRNAHKTGRRCVLVITGKGVPKGEAEFDIEAGPGGREAGVLRRMVPQWLNGPELRPMVLGISTAQPKDGGAGALYVLLKRQRP